MYKYSDGTIKNDDNTLSISFINPTSSRSNSMIVKVLFKIEDYEFISQRDKLELLINELNNILEDI